MLLKQMKMPLRVQKHNSDKFLYHNILKQLADHFRYAKVVSLFMHIQRRRMLFLCGIRLLYILIFYSAYNALILSIAATVFSYEPKAVSRKYPSPLGPNPDPGVPTTLAFSSK